MIDKNKMYKSLEGVRGMIDRDRYYILLGKHFVEYLQVLKDEHDIDDEIRILKQLNRHLILLITKMYEQMEGDTNG